MIYVWTSSYRIFRATGKHFLRNRYQSIFSEKILLGTCECKASALTRCSYVAAPLYALEDFVKKFGRNNIPRTSKLCTWNQGRKCKKPVVVGERQYSEKRVQKTKKDFDPRRPDTVCKEKESKLKVTRLLNRMKSITYENQLATVIFRAEGPKEITDGKQRTEEWFLVRKLLITASEVKTFTLPKTSIKLFTVVKNHLWDDIAQIISSAIQHGQR